MHCAPSNTIFVLPWSLGRVVLVVSFIETSVSPMVSRWAEKLKDGFCVRAVSSLECGLFHSRPGLRCGGLLHFTFLWPLAVKLSCSDSESLFLQRVVFVEAWA